MKVFYGQEKASILGQYITFCKVFDAQIAKYDYTKKAMEETLSICKDQKVLEKFLKPRMQNRKKACGVSFLLIDD